MRGLDVHENIDVSDTKLMLGNNIGAQCGDIDACRGISGDIGVCGVSITPQMCNRVTNPLDICILSRPV